MATWLHRRFSERNKARNYFEFRLYVHVVVAFYSLLRERVLRCIMYDEVIARVVAALGFDEATTQELAEHLGPCALYEAAVNLHLAELVLESHQGSWFDIKGVRPVVATHRGVLPGDSFADIVFKFLTTKTSNRIEVALERDGLGVQL